MNGAPGELRLSAQTLKKVRAVKEVEFEGSTLVCEEIKYEEQENYRIVFKNLAPGDLYIGRRNTGWEMSKVADGRLWELMSEYFCVYGVDRIYPYNVNECLKVLEIR